MDFWAGTDGAHPVYEEFPRKVAQAVFAKDYCNVGKDLNFRILFRLLYLLYVLLCLRTLFKQYIRFFLRHTKTGSALIWHSIERVERSISDLFKSCFFARVPLTLQQKIHTFSIFLVLQKKTNLERSAFSNASVSVLYNKGQRKGIMRRPVFFIQVACFSSAWQEEEQISASRVVFSHHSYFLFVKNF